MNKIGTQAMAAIAAAILSTTGVGLEGPFPAPAFAAVDATTPAASRAEVKAPKTKSSTQKNADLVTVKTLYKSAFEQSEKLSFSDLGWGDAEATVLSQALYDAKGLKKLFLNGNAIQCAGATNLALRAYAKVLLQI